MYALGAFPKNIPAETKRAHISLKYPCRASDGTVSYWAGLQVAQESPEMWVKLMKMMTDAISFPEVGFFIEDGYEQIFATPLDKPITANDGSPLSVYFIADIGVRRLDTLILIPIDAPSTYQVRYTFLA